jgi:hypothetical protein
LKESGPGRAAKIKKRTNSKVLRNTEGYLKVEGTEIIDFLSNAHVVRLMFSSKKLLLTKNHVYSDLNLKKKKKY